MSRIVFNTFASRGAIQSGRIRIQRQSPMPHDLQLCTGISRLRTKSNSSTNGAESNPPSSGVAVFQPPSWSAPQTPAMAKYIKKTIRLIARHCFIGSNTNRVLFFMSNFDEVFGMSWRIEDMDVLELPLIMPDHAKVRAQDFAAD